ncbi:hypothetical protein HAX54_030806, partial [Datura stramonium]|nr:hypothetical protein [Datura stramonium]
DHSQLSTSVEESPDYRAKPSRFYNYLSQQPNFLDRVKKSWLIYRRGMRGVWKNLKPTKVEMKDMNKREFAGTHEKDLIVGSATAPSIAKAHICRITISCLNQEKTYLDS